MYKDRELGLVIQFWHYETTFFEIDDKVLR